MRGTVRKILKRQHILYTMSCKQHGVEPQSFRKMKRQYTMLNGRKARTEVLAKFREQEAERAQEEEHE